MSKKPYFWVAVSLLLSHLAGKIFETIRPPAEPLVALMDQYLGAGLEADPMFWFILSLFVLHGALAVCLMVSAGECRAVAVRLLR